MENIMLDFTKTGIHIKDNFAFFWGGVLSNWHKCHFIVDDVKYTSSEQFMMHQKAVLFQDSTVAKLIMKTTDPKKQKALGKTVKGFDNRIWDQVKNTVVLEGCFEKFYQNPELTKILLSTEDYYICESSPYDKIWGCGLSMNDPNITDKTKWTGQNLLGLILMDVRKELINIQNF
jgi:ribA/ribD-fused uncharacterized protein